MKISISTCVVGEHAADSVEVYGLPRLDEIWHHVIVEEDQAVDALLAGEVDMMDGPVGFENIMRVTDAGYGLGYGQTWDLSDCIWFGAGLYCDYFPQSAGEKAGQPAQPMNDSAFRKAMTYVFGMERKKMSLMPWYGCAPTVYFGIGNIVPVAQAEWFNPDAEWPTTDVDYAWMLLEDAGYIVVDSVLYNPDGTPVRDIEFCYPGASLYMEAVVGDWVLYMNEFMDNIGAMVSPTFKVVGQDYDTLIHRLLYDHDYDIMLFFLRELGRHPEWLHDLFHSTNISPGGSNFVEFSDPTCDELLDTMMFSLNSTEVRQACYDFQERFTEFWPLFPIASEFTIHAHNPELVDFVPMDCYPGATCYVSSNSCYTWSNSWTWMHMHWANQLVGGSVRRHLDSSLGCLNPLYARKDSWQLLDQVFPRLLAINPATLEDCPWIAYDWDVEQGSWPQLGIKEDMKVTFYLRNDVYWQDGVQLTAEDIKYSWDFILKHNPPTYRGNNVNYTWENLVFTETNGEFIVSAYINTTSLFIPSYLADVALLCPKHIWERVDKKVESGEWTSPKDFTPWNISYKDWTGNDPPAEYPFMKALVGCGPFVFDYWNSTTGVAHVVNNERFWVNSPVEAAVNAYFRVDPAEEGGNGLPFEIVLMNTGSQTNSEFANATVDVEIYVDDEHITTVANITMHPFKSLTLGPYTTDPLPVGEHTIKVKVIKDDEVIDTYIHTVYATIEEDLDLNLKVDITDILKAAKAFGSYLGHPRWNPLADISGDFKVSILDIGKIAKKFGWRPL